MKAYLLASNESWIVSSLETFTKREMGGQHDVKCVVFSWPSTTVVLSRCNEANVEKSLCSCHLIVGQGGHIVLLVPLEDPKSSCITSQGLDHMLQLLLVLNHLNRTILLFLLVEQTTPPLGSPIILGICLLEQHEWATEQTCMNGSKSLPLIQLPKTNAIVASQEHRMPNSRMCVEQPCLIHTRDTNSPLTKVCIKRKLQ